MTVEYHAHRSPYISIQPGVLGGTACVNGYRMSAEQVASQWASGNWSVKDMEDGWPESLDHNSVVVVCWYMARYGGRKWKKAWGGWLMKYNGRLWKGDKKTPLPPRFAMGETGDEANLTGEMTDAEYRELVERIRAEQSDGFWTHDWREERSA